MIVDKKNGWLRCASIKNTTFAQFNEKEIFTLGSLAGTENVQVLININTPPHIFQIKSH
jgi:hypothetical protein